MSANLWLTTPSGARVDLHLAAPDAEVATVDVDVCTCGSNEVRAGNRRIESHDTYAADAICAGCGAAIGVARLRVDTLFGLEEDEAVLVHGRARVYG